jgi:hypothetical protein
MYLPTIDHSLWPVALVIAAFVPLSLWHEHNWRATLAAYADARRAAGAADGTWPDTEMSVVLSLQPWLLMAVALMLAAMVALGGAALAAWPHRLTGFDETINYFDRPYLSAMLVAGLAGVVAVVAVAIDLWRSPWSGVANQVRRCVYAPADERGRRFETALARDPGVPSAHQRLSSREYVASTPEPGVPL